jgi:hypothetical protein
MNMAAKYRKKDKIAGRKIAGESFLIPVCGQPSEMENIFVLNPLADFIWQRLDGEHTLEKVITEIVATFAVEREQASADAVDFVGQLIENELIEEVA